MKGESNFTMKEKKCSSGRTPGFIQPCILLLLYQNKSYGYELIENLKNKDFFDTTPDPGTVYRVLRKYEKDGLVVSKWLESETGPAKRLYWLTKLGEVKLMDWEDKVKKKVDTLNRFLCVFNETSFIKKGK